MCFVVVKNFNWHEFQSWVLCEGARKAEGRNERRPDRALGGRVDGWMGRLGWCCEGDKTATGGVGPVVMAAASLRRALAQGN